MKLIDVFSSPSFPSIPFTSPYIIAEAGVNHEGSFDTAKRLIQEAAEAGAHAIKFQTYKAHTLASKFSPSYWDLSEEPTDSQFKLFQKFDSFWKDEYEQLAHYCQSFNIEFLSTPFDFESAKFLADLMPAFKISSSDITNKPLIEFIASFNKPLILSTGASFKWEIEQALSWIAPYGNPVSLLHCILNYPTLDSNASLARIATLRDSYPQCVVGYSDHTLPQDMQILELASVLGARIIEKHFTHDKSLKGNDHYHSMDKVDLHKFVDRMNNLSTLMGDPSLTPLPSEQISRKNARRSIVATTDISAGSIITKNMLTCKRPGHGIEPRFISDLIGREVRVSIPNDTLITWSMIHD